MRKIINYDEISKQISLNSCSIIGHPKSGKASLLNYITNSFNHISRLNKINIIYRNAKLNSIIHSFVTCFTSLQTTLGQISVLQISQICIFVISINFKEYIQHILETLMCIECSKIHFCLICITHTELYDKEFVTSNLNQLKNIINLSCKHEFLLINPIYGYNMNNFNNIINYYSKQYWMKKSFIINSKPYFTIIRSYDFTSKNKTLDKIQGGVVGGYINNGFIPNNTNICIKPGLISKDNKKIFSIKSSIINIQSDKSPVNYCLPQGINGIELSLDPYFTSDNKLRGHILGPPHSLPPVYNKIGFKFDGLKKIFVNTYNQKEVIMKSLALNESIILSINSIFINGLITNIGKNNFYLLKLSAPKCLDLNDNTVVFRQINNRWMVSGFANNLIGSSISSDTFITNKQNYDSILFVFNKKNNLIVTNNKPFFLLKNKNPLHIFTKPFYNKLQIILQYNDTLNFTQYSKFKFKITQLEEALKILNILYTKSNNNVLLNLTYNDYILNYSKKIKNVFKCNKCSSFTFMFYKKNSMNLQICSHCGNYII